MREVQIHFLILIFTCCLTSCSSGQLKPRTVEDFYASTGVEKYFLTEIPAWSNFDLKGACFRSSGIRYFNIDALMKSYALSYAQALQLQASFNEEYATYKKSSQSPVPTLKEEELLFYKVSEKISSKIPFFDPPAFKRIHLVWLDEVLADPKKEKKLRAFLNSSTMDSGVPVLVSFCLTRQDIETKFTDLNLKMITAELFSIYEASGKSTPGFKVDLSQFFKPDQQLYFYSQKNLVPVSVNDELKGTFKYLNY